MEKNYITRANEGGKDFLNTSATKGKEGQHIQGVKLNMREKKTLLGHQKYTFKS